MTNPKRGTLLVFRALFRKKLDGKSPFLPRYTIPGFRSKCALCSSISFPARGDGAGRNPKINRFPPNSKVMCVGEAKRRQRSFSRFRIFQLVPSPSQLSILYGSQEKKRLGDFFIEPCTRALRLETVVNSLISGQSKKPERDKNSFKGSPGRMSDRSLS